MTVICPPARALNPLCSHIQAVSTSYCHLCPQAPAAVPLRAPTITTKTSDPCLQLGFPGTHCPCRAGAILQINLILQSLLRSSHWIPRPLDITDPFIWPDRPRLPVSSSLSAGPSRHPHHSPQAPTNLESSLFPQHATFSLASGPYMLAPLCDMKPASVLSLSVAYPGPHMIRTLERCVL